VLYLVATPIGNLDDISLRALATLREVDIVASEDTRKTGLLLKHFGIQKPQLAFHEHNEERVGERIMGLIAEGKRVALVTNAGTPGIADPGFTLMRRAIRAGAPVTAIPGPAAFVPAVVLSGLAVHSFTFRGFPPRKPGARRAFLAVDQASPHTLVFYESPHRLATFLEDALVVYGDRDAALANDLTKFYETVQRGKLSDLLATVHEGKPRGEYVAVIAGASSPSPAGGGPPPCGGEGKAPGTRGGELPAASHRASASAPAFTREPLPSSCRERSAARVRRGGGP
jgi:16S rRNA (cytidine1402-2'-O)-methyltransferase